MFKLLTLSAGSLLLCSCSRPAGVARAPVRAPEALIAADAALSQASFTKGPLTALLGAFGRDGVLAWPGGPVLVGDSAVANFFGSQPLMNSVQISWQPLRIDLSPDSTLAVIVGVATLDRPATGPVSQMHRIGRYLAAWNRSDTTWRLAAFGFVNLITAGETIWRDVLGPRELPLLKANGAAAAFVAADSAFAADAQALGVAAAFTKWAAPDAMTFAVSGEVNSGPERVGAVLAGGASHWVWGAVAAGASADGTLGWTIGQATITPANGGAPMKSKYFTLWRKMPDGSVRFTADGGSTRP
jgi:ketosteroid isomerase-like protein